MFDVDWSDPNRESVGDRRVRKQKQHTKGNGKKDGSDPNNSCHDNAGNEDEGLDDKTDDQSGNRTSGSIRSSVSSAEKQFGFFGGKHRKKGTSSSRKGKTKSVASSSLRAPTIEEQPYNETTSTSSQGLQPPSTSGPPDPSHGLPPKRFSSEFGHCLLSSASKNLYSITPLHSFTLIIHFAQQPSFPHCCFASEQTTTHIHDGKRTVKHAGLEQISDPVPQKPDSHEQDH